MNRVAVDLRPARSRTAGRVTECRMVTAPPQPGLSGDDYGVPRLSPGVVIPAPEVVVGGGLPRNAPVAAAVGARLLPDGSAPGVGALAPIAVRFGSDPSGDYAGAIMAGAG